MDEKVNQVIELGKKYIEIIKNDPVLNLDYTEETLNNVQAWIASLKGSNTGDSYRSKAMIGFAVYIGEMIQKQFPELAYNIIFQDDLVDEVQLKDNKGKEFNLLSWVRKCYADPEGENIVFKYKKTVELLQNQGAV